MTVTAPDASMFRDVKHLPKQRKPWGVKLHRRSHFHAMRRGNPRERWKRRGLTPGPLTIGSDRLRDGAAARHVDAALDRAVRRLAGPDRLGQGRAQRPVA